MMSNRSKNPRAVCPAKWLGYPSPDRKILLLAICLAVIPCAVAKNGAEGLQSSQPAAEVRGPKTEDRRQRTEDGGQKTDFGLPTSDFGLRASGPWRTIRMKVTAYCPCPKCCGKYSDGVTASGHKIAQGDRFLAADKRHSFGTEMIVPGYNDSQPVAVLDRGGAIRGDRLDVFFNSHRQARQWGVQHLLVKVRAD